MFVYSLKASKLKTVGIILFCVAVIGTAAVFTLKNSSDGFELSQVAAQGKDIRFDGIKTEEDLQKFIKSLGIEVKTPAYKTKEVDLPRVFDAVYGKYNGIQKQQGFDLSKYCGKTLMRYTYEVLNYPSPDGSSVGKVYLTLFVYKNKIVGGDISSRDYGGFVRTFVDFSAESGTAS